MDMGIQGRVAVVAASSTGLGKAVALGLAREGAKLAICGRTKLTLEAAADEIRDATGAEVLARVVDVSVEKQVSDFMADVRHRYGAVDICVANAGGPPSKPFDQTTVAEWEAAVQLNLMSTLFMVREVLPAMRAQKWGRIITITSVAVKQPLEGLVLSNSVRSAVMGLVKSLANECGADNVLVNNVCPGFTATARLKGLAGRLADAEGLSPDEIEARWTTQIPVRRLGTPEEFANLVVFLASERASYINGTSIAVDGGLVKGV
ncbi:MAG: SDR family oxidoreductase [Bryobacteraceae bacterium]